MQRSHHQTAGRSNYLSDLALAIDIGSTYTKVCLVDLETTRLVSTSRAPTTVETDVNTGLETALAGLSSGGRSFNRRDACVVRACSSAAGGLRVVVVGLVRALSVEAARRAALGAGAKIVGGYSAKLTLAEARDIEASEADVVLLAGGTDGGDEATITHNASVLADSAVECPVIVAGNKVAAAQCNDALEAAGKRTYATENILPDLDTVNAGPVRQVIRDLFMSHIIHAKGIDGVREYAEGEIVPTPSAVMAAAQLLAEGTSAEPGMGELVVVDVGGATTDVHSMARGEPSDGSVVQRGLPEPFAKRTVEGDIGLRENAESLMAQADRRRIQDTAESLEPGSSNALDSYVAEAAAHREYVPCSAAELAMDAALARVAVETAVSRHAGTIHEVYTPMGPVRVQRGKDLRRTGTVIGAGGVFVSGGHPRVALEGVIAGANDPSVLVPTEPRLYVDKAYLLYAVGLLADVDPDAAFRLAAANLEQV